MRTKIIVWIIIALVIIPIPVEGRFSFSKAWKKVSSLPGKTGKFVAGATGMGGIVEGSFEPAINRLEEANRKSINLLDEKLNLRLNQFNNILEARQEQ